RPLRAERNAPPYCLPPGRANARGRELLRWRDPRAPSAAARRVPRGQRELGALPPLEDGRALRVARGRLRARLVEGAERVLQTAMLRLRRVRRGTHQGSVRPDGCRKHRVLDGLPPPGLQVPTRGRAV